MDHSAELLEPEQAPVRPTPGTADGAPAGNAHSVEAPAMASITVCPIGLSQADQVEFERLTSRVDPISPRLIPLSPAEHPVANVILIDGRDFDARDWWRQHREVLYRRPMVWVDQRSPYEAHTTLVRPVMWSQLPIILYRAAQVAPERRALVARPVAAQSAAFVVIAPRSMAGAQLRWMLENVGYRATVARNAREGLAALHAAPYAGLIVAADLLGPPLDIADICRRVRQFERRLGRLPILVLNANLSTWQRWRASFAGPVEFADWPEHALQLKALLQQLPAATPATRKQRTEG